MQVAEEPEISGEEGEVIEVEEVCSEKSPVKNESNKEIERIKSEEELYTPSTPGMESSASVDSQFSDLDFEKKGRINFFAKHIPLWVMFFLLMFVILIAYTYGKSSRVGEYNLVVDELDRVLDSVYQTLDPRMKSLKDEIFNLTYEPIRKYLEEKVDPIYESLKIRYKKYKSIFRQYVNVEEDEETMKMLERIRNLNLTAKHPIIIIPGSITSNLEVWEGKSCMKNFREKVWGGLEMFKTFLKDIDCWIEHIMLDEETGLDPEGIRVRPRAEAIEYFVPFYWVWARTIEELSRIGYDRNNMRMMEYDWRLGYEDLQKRDNYFARVKMNIELLTQFTGEKVVILTHSMGGLVTNYFLNWVESPQGGGETAKFLGLKKNKWCERHIESIVNIGSPILGLPKVLSSLISGEMKDTADFYWADGLLERLLPKEHRIRAFRSWGSMYELVPKGPAELWGNLFEIPTEDEEERRNITMDSLIPFLKKNTDKMTSKRIGRHFYGVKNHKFSQSPLSLGVDSVVEKVLGQEIKNNVTNFFKSKPLKKLFRKWINKEEDDDEVFSYEESEEDEEEEEEEEYVMDNPRYWSNPFAFQLPHAPSMSIYCMYGVGVETEIGYKIIERKKQKKLILEQHQQQLNENEEDEDDKLWTYEFDFVTGLMSQQEEEEEVVEYISTSTEEGGQIIIDETGDGTCPRVSMGYTCNQLWKDERYNPGNVKTYTREYSHRPIENILSSQFDLRGGGFGASHVDILGNLEMLEDIFYIVAGKSKNITDSLIYPPFKKIEV